MGIRRHFNRLRYGRTLDSHAPDGETMLTAAVRLGDDEAIAAILRLGASASQPNRRGESPLHIAIAQGDRAAFRQLVEAGADVGGQHNGPLCRHALAHGQPEMAAIINAIVSREDSFSYVVGRGAMVGAGPILPPSRREVFAGRDF